MDAACYRVTTILMFSTQGMDVLTLQVVKNVLENMTGLPG